ncbi:unnamed protein product [Prorocentrum cordatum]|uniref:Uncharacterized protein n=1 Tax=Prorocentrum cordatum TaxID=2364126 RepID=A0ABN9V0H2_9DINO|nr:unnamed protein product [Polarella glacialis]
MYHTVLLRSDGAAVACGNNSFGQCDCPALVEGFVYTLAFVLSRHYGCRVGEWYLCTRFPRRLSPFTVPWGFPGPSGLAGGVCSASRGGLGHLGDATVQHKDLDHKQPSAFSSPTSQMQRRRRQCIADVSAMRRDLLIFSVRTPSGRTLKTTRTNCSLD